MPVIFPDEIRQQVSNKFLAVNIIAQRGLQLSDTHFLRPFHDDPKPVDTAIEEFRAGLVDYETLDTARDEKSDSPRRM